MAAPLNQAPRRRTLVASAITVAVLAGSGTGALLETLTRPRLPAIESIAMPSEVVAPMWARCWLVPKTLPAGYELRQPEVVRMDQTPPLIEERFNDANLAARGWYDNLNLTIEGGALRYTFRAGASMPDSGAGSRIQFTPSREVALRYRIKYSDGWVGSGQDFHPHEFYLLTNLDGRYASLARSHLTVYVEQNAGRPGVLIQDALNIGTGAVAGCDPLLGVPTGYPRGDCYMSGANQMNGRAWYAPVVAFAPGEWHSVEARIRLNTPGQPDGILSVAVDGTRVLSISNAILRTARNTSQLLNQFVIGPYMSRSPIEQTSWVDDIQLWGTP